MAVLGTFARFASLAAMCAFAAACSSSSTTTTSQSSSGSPGPSGSVIKIGIDLPVSGADASTGIPTRNGAVAAIEDANARGVPGGFKFVAYDLDDAVQGAHDPAQGAQNTKTFVADEAVLAMVGPFNSSVAQAEIPITNDAGLAQISPAATNPGLTKGPVAARLRTSHPDANAFFRVCATDDWQGLALARGARALGSKKVFVIDDNETYGKGLADVFDAQFKMLGGTVIGHEHLTKGQTDYKALLTKAHALAPDLIFFGGTTSTGGGLLRKQMADAALGGLPYLGGDGISDAEFLTTAGANANGTYYTVAAPAGAAAFVAAYKRRFNSEVGAYSANGYAAAAAEVAAIEKAIVEGGNKLPTRADVLRHVAATKNLDTPIGKVGFDAAGDTTHPALSMYKITGGKAQVASLIDLSKH
ncbi:MAG: branched-chain amino acid ABC transporter substrate-binding protein [Candidatus Eremiobacteraeota bacterium]|nr:branched-chain amino acid ABC transporter substrate-binding protein [Candidatus Eremiobacteraeota bacterium]